jgi:O-phosphoseryl-tRNA(Cys) synthetase
MGKQSKFPQGWDEERVRGVLKHYESQSEAEAVAEAEAALDISLATVMNVLKELVPQVRELIARHKKNT